MRILNSYLNNELFKASIFLMVLSNLGNVLNLIFQFFMARMLSPQDFGALAFITNLIFIFGVPALAIQTIISKKTTMLRSSNQYAKIRGVFNSTTRRLLLISFILSLAFIVLSFFIYKQVEIDLDIMIISSIFIILSFIYPVIIGVMQGLKIFTAIGWNNFILFSLKLISGVVLVLLGFRIYGAMTSIALGMFVAWLMALWFIKDLKEEKEEIELFNLKELFPFIALLIITLIYNIDILVGKFLFPTEIIGNYSKISLLGKMILFACLSIGTVMFPLSSERHINGFKSSGIMKKSSILVSIICALGLLSFLIFPKQIVWILFGSKYIGYSNLLLPLGIAFSALSGLYLLVLYGLSTNRFRILETSVLMLTFLSQVITLVIFSKNILLFANSFAISSMIIFILMLILTLRWKS